MTMNDNDELMWCGGLGRYISEDELNDILPKIGDAVIIDRSNIIRRVPFVETTKGLCCFETVNCSGIQIIDPNLDAFRRIRECVYYPKLDIANHITRGEWIIAKDPQIFDDVNKIVKDAYRKILTKLIIATRMD